MAKKHSKEERNQIFLQSLENRKLNLTNQKATNLIQLKCINSKIAKLNFQRSLLESSNVVIDSQLKGLSVSLSNFEDQL